MTGAVVSVACPSAWQKQIVAEVTWTKEREWGERKSVEWKLQLLPHIAARTHESAPVIGVPYLLIHSSVTLTHN